jgi:CheY-like chemotaxis protein
MASGGDTSVIEILLVEDNPSDARLTQETLKNSERRLNITVAQDGEIAMEMLRKEGEHANTPRPDLILLDLRMPRVDGFEVLKQIGQDADLKQIPLVLLTGTQVEQSELSEYNIPPSRYWRKPITLERFNLAVRRLDSIGWKISTASFL